MLARITSSVVMGGPSILQVLSIARSLLHFVLGPLEARPLALGWSPYSCEGIPAWSEVVPVTVALAQQKEELQTLGRPALLGSVHLIH